MINRNRRALILILPLLLLVFGVAPGMAAHLLVQCPGDTNGDLIPDQPGYENVVCKHISAGDGFINMADGKLQYMFGFADIPPGTPVDQTVSTQLLKAEFPAPTIVIKEGQELYLGLTNVGMIMRPDLFDAHSIHYHGFPNAAPVFDGLPEASPTVRQGATFTYYFKAKEPGTFFYHCHVEATEHMQMGMIGNLWVTPAQDGTPFTDPENGKTYTKFAYNDGDGSTGYDVAYPLQVTGFDSNFHDLHIAVQPLPFAAMKDNYAMVNGRGYPQTINPNELANSESGDRSQKMNARVIANKGERILLRLSSVATVDYFTVAILGIPMKVVGTGARILRGPTGKNAYYETASLNIGGGQAFDVLLDTSKVRPGTYFLYTTNLNHLVNGPQERGGLMTEIVVGP
jgi:FtsP/CotA-like multicopper oxidase with cupredoxin domain